MIDVIVVSEERAGKTKYSNNCPIMIKNVKLLDVFLKNRLTGFFRDLRPGQDSNLRSQRERFSRPSPYH